MRVDPIQARPGAESAIANEALAPSRFTWNSRDGLRLSGVDWRPTVIDHTKLPILCLPGLSRNTRDFNSVAEFLQELGHRVIVLDYRGRGQSDWDPEWQNYNLAIEGHDIDDAVTQLDLDRFAILGTSRGGLHAMAMSQRYDTGRIAAVVLNDIGPHVEMRAIHRLAATIGRSMRHADMPALARDLAHGLGTQFPTMTEADWLRFAGQLGSERDGGIVLDYDPALSHQLASFDDGTPWPDLWPLFDGLKETPLLIVHGALSDLLTAETCAEMRRRHGSAELVTVKDQGHAPLLWDRATQQAIAEFFRKSAPVS